MRRRLFLVVGVVAGLGVLAAAGTAGARVAWPAPSILPTTAALLRVSIPGVGGKVESVRVLTMAAREVPVRLRGGEVWPLRSLPQGEPLVAEVTVRRPGWASWLVGATATKTFALTTPVAHVATRVLHVRDGEPVAVRLDAPATLVTVDGVARRGRRSVVTIPAGANAGTAEVAASPRTWERLSRPVRISWFPISVSRAVVTSPAPGATLSPAERLTLSFSSRVARPLPPIRTNAPGRWVVVDDHSIAFEPSASGYPLGGTLRVVLPSALRAVVPSAGRTAGTLTWPVAAGTTLRLQQLLAQLDYLPLRWRARGAAPAQAAAAQLEAAVSPPTGTFTWRWKHVPPPLRSVSRATLTRAAVMRFEDAHGLAADGIAGPAVWRALLADVAAGRTDATGYTYVLVHETVPESLQLWHDGKVVLTTPGNTGVPQAPTQRGTFAVFEHIPVGTMSGTNPDGSHYHDPGVRWISYFNGGDAIHAFNRASYGTPQSLGCVELPLEVAGRVWPYTPVGTLVTVTK